eukprot:scaffold2044_cov305-Pavlova_lutheri.AAC.23
MPAFSRFIRIFAGLPEDPTAMDNPSARACRMRPSTPGKAWMPCRFLVVPAGIVAAVRLAVIRHGCTDVHAEQRHEVFWKPVRWIEACHLLHGKAKSFARDALRVHQNAVAVEDEVSESRGHVPDWRSYRDDVSRRLVDFASQQLEGRSDPSTAVALRATPIERAETRTTGRTVQFASHFAVRCFVHPRQRFDEHRPAGSRPSCATVSLVLFGTLAPREGIGAGSCFVFQHRSGICDRSPTGFAAVQQSVRSRRTVWIAKRCVPVEVVLLGQLCSTMGTIRDVLLVQFATHASKELQLSHETVVGTSLWTHLADARQGGVQGQVLGAHQVCHHDCRAPGHSSRAVYEHVSPTFDLLLQEIAAHRQLRQQVGIFQVQEGHLQHLFFRQRQIQRHTHRHHRRGAFLQRIKHVLLRPQKHVLRHARPRHAAATPRLSTAIAPIPTDPPPFLEFHPILLRSSLSFAQGCGPRNSEGPCGP